jgi:prepilin-type N-terminal cleavage/methylation domain-containing protein
MQTSATNRNGFTMVELLVVIAILAVIAVLTLMVFRAGAGSEKMRSAARVVQSAFLGAKDRALHARDLRGVRLIRDPSNPVLVPGFVYLQPLPMLTYPAGSFRLDRLDVNPHDNVPDSADILIVRGNSSPATPAVDWDAKTQFFSNPGRIRIPTGSGQWYTFTWSTSGSYPLSAANEVLQLMTPFA